MNRRMIWLGGVLLAAAAFSFAAVVEQGLTVRGRAEEWVVPTCTYVTVYVDEGSPQVDIALRSLDKLTERVIKAVKDKNSGVREFLTKAESIKVATKILATQHFEMRRYYVRNRLRIVCDPDMMVASDAFYSACNAGAIPYGTPYFYDELKSDKAMFALVGDDRTNRVVYFGVEKNEELTRRMYEKALANAEERAKIHAELSGKKVGKILSIQCDEVINGEVPANWAVENGFPCGIIGIGPDKVYVSYEAVVTYEIAE